jgi:hypothetical protein
MLGTMRINFEPFVALHTYLISIIVNLHGIVSVPGPMKDLHRTCVDRHFAHRTQFVLLQPLIDTALVEMMFARETMNSIALLVFNQADSALLVVVRYYFSVTIRRKLNKSIHGTKKESHLSPKVNSCSWLMRFFEAPSGLLKQPHMKKRIITHALIPTNTPHPARDRYFE